MEISRDDLQRFVGETSWFPELPQSGFGSSLRASFAMAPTKRRHVSFATLMCVMLTCSRVRGDSSKEGSFLAVVLVTYFSGRGEPMACSCSWKIRGTSAWKMRAISSRHVHPRRRRLIKNHGDSSLSFASWETTSFSLLEDTVSVIVEIVGRDFFFQSLRTFFCVYSDSNI